MKSIVRKLGRLGAALLVTALLFGCAGQQVQKTEEKSPKQVMMESDWKFHDIVDVAFVQQYVKVPQPEGVTIVDSRPYKPKYINGHIPTAISLPDAQFDKLVDKLPKDKNSLLIFYCEGYTWKLSHKSAWKAEKLGYKNIKVFAAGFPAYIKAPGSYAGVSVEYVAQQIAVNEAILVDSRPKKPKYDKGHIPTAMSIPDSEFGKLKGKLPTDKNIPLIFYCEGYTWKLSHNSARRAIELGYTNVKVFAAGYPAYKKYAGITAEAVTVATGEEEGAIEIAAFEKLLKEKPESVMIVDVRDPDEYTAGSLKTAINIPTDLLAEKIPTFPSDKPIIFICNTGAKSGEAFYMVQDLRPELKNVYYLDAECTYGKDGSHAFKKHE